MLLSILREAAKNRSLKVTYTERIIEDEKKTIVKILVTIPGT